MISQIFDTGPFKVLALFAISPGSRFRRKEIKEKTKMHNVPLDNSLSKLTRSDIIKKEKGLYSINLESKYSEQIINIMSLQHKQMKNLPLDVYFLLIDMVEEVSIIKGLELWLFGSYSKLVYSEKSDVDIALITSSDVNKERIIKILKKLGKQYNKKIEEHFFDSREFYKNKRDPLVKDILQNGIRLL